jgi:hypothetical protein
LPEEARMKVSRVDGTCRDGTCPTIYATDRGTFVIQGFLVDASDVDHGIALAAGEALVEIPGELYRRIGLDR